MGHGSEVPENLSLWSLYVHTTFVALRLLTFSPHFWDSKMQQKYHPIKLWNITVYDALENLKCKRVVVNSFWDTMGLDAWIYWMNECIA